MNRRPRDPTALGSLPARDSLGPTGLDAVDAVVASGGTAYPLDLDVPAPRFAFAGLLVATLRVLEVFGAISARLGDGDVASLAAAARTQVARRLDAGDDDLARVARRIGRTLPLIYGVGPVGGVAADRWKDQITDNAKVAAFASAVPELVHHELSGWGQHGDMTRQVFTLVTLRHDHELPADAELMPGVEVLVDEVVAGRHEIRAAGDGPLAQLLDLVVQGDTLSFHLAQANEIDPGPTSTDELLARWG